MHSLSGCAYITMSGCAYHESPALSPPGRAGTTPRRHRQPAVLPGEEQRGPERLRHGPAELAKCLQLVLDFRGSTRRSPCRAASAADGAPAGVCRVSLPRRRLRAPHSIDAAARAAAGEPGGPGQACVRRACRRRDSDGRVRNKVRDSDRRWGDSEVPASPRATRRSRVDGRGPCLGPGLEPEGPGYGGQAAGGGRSGRVGVGGLSRGRQAAGGGCNGVVAEWGRLAWATERGLPRQIGGRHGRRCKASGQLEAE